jgi:hypothetical protein
MALGHGLRPPALVGLVQVRGTASVGETAEIYGWQPPVLRWARPQLP